MAANQLYVAEEEEEDRGQEMFAGVVPPLLRKKVTEGAGSGSERVSE